VLRESLKVEMAKFICKSKKMKRLQTL